MGIQMKKRGWFFLLIMGLCMPLPGMAQEAPVPPLLSVRGEAQLMVSPDQVVMLAGVLSESKDAKKALADNSRAMNQVIAALKGIGIKKTEINTQNFSIQPQWSPRPRNAETDWRATIIAYRVSNNVQVKTTQLELIGEMIAKATQAGANQIHSVSFGLSNPREFRAQALKQAVENARADADIAAAAAATRIVGIKTLNVDHSVASIETVEKAMVMRSAMADAAPAPPISSGDISVRASVFISYKLAD